MLALSPSTFTTEAYPWWLDIKIGFRRTNWLHIFRFWEGFWQSSS